MRKIVFLLASVLLFARENPFLPKVDINNPSPIEEMKQFSKVAFNVPDDARVLNKLRLYYTSIDGSMKQYDLKIEEGLDWHKVYMLLDADEISKQANKDEEKVLNEEEKIKEALNYEEEKKQEVVEVKKEEVVEYKPIEYYLGSNFSVIIDRNLILIKTYNRLIRQFTLKNPNRIVLDFKTNFTFKNAFYNVSNSPVNQIYTGVHNDFYRLVLKLDGLYNYDVKKGKNEYIIKLQ